jgi:hypothetical protein
MKMTENLKTDTLTTMSFIRLCIIVNEDICTGIIHYMDRNVKYLPYLYFVLLTSKKESLNSDGQQFYQYQQKKRKITVYTFFCFVDIGGFADHHCLNFLLFC